MSIVYDRTSRKTALFGQFRARLSDATERQLYYNSMWRNELVLIV